MNYLLKIADLLVLVLFVVSTLVLIPQDARAAVGIAFDAATQSQNFGAGSPGGSWSHTVTGSNTVLVCGIENASHVDDLGTPTYNGVSMTFVAKVDSSAKFDYVYYLLNPTTGANNVSVTRTNTTSVMNAVCASYTGVSQVGFPDNSTTNSTAAASSLTTSLTSNSANDWFVIFGENNNNTTQASTNVTSRKLTFQTSGLIGDSNAPEPQANFSQTLNIASGSGSWGEIMLSMAPAPSVPAAAGTLQINKSIMLIVNGTLKM